MKCKNCRKEYKSFAIANYNLDLCKNCVEKFEKDNRIRQDYACDKVTHKIICPKCGKIYKADIVDKKCENKDCNVWFFWDSLDCVVFARWINVDKGVVRKK